MGTATLRTLPILLLLVSCFSTGSAKTGDPYYDLRSEDVITVMNATAAVARDRNFGAIPYLITNLRHEDTWVRGFTLQALMEIRGVPSEKLGYEFTGSELSREAAIARWEEWYRDEQARRSAEAAP
ncbi:MAG: hypothetical protein AB7O52_10615 [Planctomycetota bacterium]